MMNNLKTTDIYLAAAVLSLGAELTKVDKSDPRHMEFQFTMERPDDTLGQSITTGKDLDWIANQWTNGILLVNATRYADAIRRMKSEVHTSR